MPKKRSNAQSNEYSESDSDAISCTTDKSEESDGLSDWGYVIAEGESLNRGYELEEAHECTEIYGSGIYMKDKKWFIL